SVKKPVSGGIIAGWKLLADGDSDEVGQEPLALPTIVIPNDLCRRNIQVRVRAYRRCGNPPCCFRASVEALKYTSVSDAANLLRQIPGVLPLLEAFQNDLSASGISVMAFQLEAVEYDSMLVFATADNVIQILETVWTVGSTRSPTCEPILPPVPQALAAGLLRQDFHWLLPDSPGLSLAALTSIARLDAWGAANILGGLGAHSRADGLHCARRLCGTSNRLEAPYVDVRGHLQRAGAISQSNFVESAGSNQANASLRVLRTVSGRSLVFSNAFCGLQESDSDRLCTDYPPFTEYTNVNDDLTAMQAPDRQFVPRFPGSDFFSGCIGEVSER
uniref:COIA1 protein n=1 Tax=Macrostomum lignano TaxID=282301 RepID=A0A1I8IZG8_9PLAT